MTFDEALMLALQTLPGNALYDENIPGYYADLSDSISVWNPERTEKRFDFDQASPELQALRGKYTHTYVDPATNRLSLMGLQQPGAHKYDVFSAHYNFDPNTGQYVLDDMDAQKMKSTFSKLAKTIGPVLGAGAIGAMAGMAGTASGVGAGTAGGGAGSLLGGAMPEVGAGWAGMGGPNLFGGTALTGGAGLAGGSTAGLAGGGSLLGGALPELGAGTVGAGGVGGVGSGVTGGGSMLGGAMPEFGANLGSAMSPNAMTGSTLLTGAGGAGGAGSSMSGLIPGIGNDTLLNLGTSLGGAYLQDRAIGKSVDAQLQAGQEANALLRDIWQQSRADNQPLLDMRNAILPQLQGLATNPSSITQDPGYQFGLSEGNKLLSNRATAAGNYYSGQQLKEANRYGQDYAGTKLDQSINRLLGVAGLGQVGGTQNQAANNAYAGPAAANTTDMGAVRGSGYAAQGGAWGNALGNIFNNWQTDQWMKKINPWGS